MRLALSHYLRTLRERDEFDRLLPELVTEMGYIPLVRPKAGIRQYGVDFPAVGKSPKDGIDELLLFVIKQGNITRSMWSGGPDKVLESMQEVLHAYLDGHVPPEYRGYRKVIVLATTGDFSQDVNYNWTSFIEKNPQVVFRFWGADQVAELLETHLLNEKLFDAEDRADLRKALALAGDNEYQFTDFSRLLRRQLGLAVNGSLKDPEAPPNRKALVKALRRVHLAAMVCAYWADAEGDRRQALWVMERTLLWAFHRAQLEKHEQHDDVHQALGDIWYSYGDIGHQYYDRLLPHLHVRDGMAGYGQEGAEHTVTVFEHIGLIASLGLGQIAVTPEERIKAQMSENAQVVADALAALLDNHSVCGSPRLDHQVIDVCLGLVLFCSTGREAAARQWLSHLAGRLAFVFRIDRLFPVGTDSLDDLVELDGGGASAEFKGLLKQTSWLLATIASWCAVMGIDDVYTNLAASHNKFFPEVGGQLWHPDEDWAARWYFGSVRDTGTTEAPYPLPEEAQALRNRILKFRNSGRMVWEEKSPALASGLWAIDFIACRHFRTPVPATMWYRMLPPGPADSASPAPTEVLTGRESMP